MRFGIVMSMALGLLVSACPEPDPDPPPPPPPTEDLTEPLAMPAEPTLDVASFRSAKQCQACHPEHYDQWRSSTHAYAMRDPVFRALVGLRQKDFDGRHDRFCLQCHTAIGTRGGEIKRNFSFDELSQVVLEGVTCEACHKIERLVRTHNSGHVLDEDGPMRGTIESPTESSFHQSEYSALHASSDLCGGCHDVIEYTGVNLERPYAEFVESPARSEGLRCQDCHMRKGMGPAAVGGPIREIHDHRFIGVGVPFGGSLADPEQLEDRRARVRAQLESAATLELSAPSTLPAGAQIDLVVGVTNQIRAHNFPTGSTFNRQAWLEVTARSADGRELYSTGRPDDNGDLRDYFSELDPYGDSDLITFQSGFVDGRGVPTIFPWFAAEHVTTSISPTYTRTKTLFVPTSTGTQGPVSIEAKLHFRTYRPHLIRALGLDELLDDIDSYVVAGSSLAVSLQ